MGNANSSSALFHLEQCWRSVSRYSTVVTRILVMLRLAVSPSLLMENFVSLRVLGAISLYAHTLHVIEGLSVLDRPLSSPSSEI